MDLRVDNFRSDPISDPGVRTPGVDDTPESGPNPLDGAQAVALQQKLLGLVLYEKRKQMPNRYQMALDCDFYDGDQLSEDDLIELADRGQAPLVYNLVKRTIDWMIGTERRTRFDFKVLGRTQDDVEPARIKTDAMKYVQDITRAQFHRSAAFKEMVTAGVAWLEDGARGDEDEFPLYSRNESWWYTLHDSHSLELDYSDARYHHRWKYVDTDVAEVMFPDRARFVRNAAVNAQQLDEKMADDWYLGNRLSGEDYLAGQVGRHIWTQQGGMLDSSRERVKIYETWYRKPVRERVMLSRKALPMMHGQPYDVQNDDMRHAVLIGDASLVERVNMAVHYAIYTDTAMLAMGRSPYRHNQFPFTPLWCYRRGRDNMPYGAIRNIRDPQSGFNRRMAKTIFALAAYRVTADSDAIDPKKQTWEDLRIEAGRPDAMIVKKKGTEIKVEQNREIGEEHLKLAQTEGSLILDASGVTADNLGMDSNAQSGKAIIAKQSEGSSVTAEIFDNVRLGAQLQGEKQLSLAEQFMSEEMVVRVSDVKGRPSWKKINEIVTGPDGQPRVENDITATKADFIIDQQNFHSSQRQAAYEVLMDASGKFGVSNPMLGLQILEMAIDTSDLPSKDEMVKRIRSITGFTDPEEAQTPEEKKKAEEAQAAQQAEQQKQAEMQEAAFTADLETKKADAEKKRAEVKKILVEAQAKQSEVDQLQAQGAQADPIAQAVADVQAQAQEQLGELSKQIDELTRQIADKVADREAQAATERYKADKEHDRHLGVAKIQAPPPMPAPVEEHQQMIADLASEVASLGDALKELMAKVEKGAKTEEKEKTEAKKAHDDIIKKVEAAVKSATPAASPVTLDIGKAANEGLSAMTSQVAKAVEGLEKAAQGIEAAAKQVADAADKEKNAEPCTKECELPDGRKIIIRPVKGKKKG